MTIPTRCLLNIVVLGAMLLSAALPASAAWKEKVLHSFQSIPDGAEPGGALAFDKTGNLYGATGWGGADDCPGIAQCGVVYQVQPPVKKGQPWTENVIYTFKGKNSDDGETPSGGVMFDSAGNLYGTTAYGGAGNCVLLGTTVGCGTVFELSPPQQKGGPWTETILYSFQGNTDGYFPNGDLVFDKQGNIYGATLFGGGYGHCNDFYGFCGTVFELVKPKTKGGAWTEQVLHSFRGTDLDTLTGDGANPNGGLIFDAEGAIYGTTNAGGSSIPICGNTAPFGCGTVFKLRPPQKKGADWTERILHVFVHADGTRPYSGMVVDLMGNLYGSADGGSNDSGLIFELKRPIRQGKPWRHIVVYTFTGNSDGGFPETQPIFDSSGNLYGTALGGKSTNGVVFRLKPTKSGKWAFAVLYNFQGSPDGRWPVSRLLFDSAGNLFSATQNGGTNNSCIGGCGTVFELSP